ncbi:solute carrier family 2, facilitated glucose transporter member 3-like isoform X2 [Hydractinia symbiolongicarpus]|uniref:solute carrier family 2, facilitated glucose transporter member 3-like isoform X2 n=1 Tax=Hydractinia symbiolongicarpus TaxID=13093 RepID=UPI00254DDA67|nr:solute carrier family 2, facilitated glucose transporter member 3-like isoform X2 [Hydractinia symbiolongicarpus]
MYELLQADFDDDDTSTKNNFKGRNRTGSNLKSCLCALVISSGMLQFGFNLASVNNVNLVVKDFFKDVDHFESFIWPMAVAIFAIGGMIGSYFGSHAAKRFGRKYSLLINNSLVICGGILLFCSKEANSVALLIIGRILVGLNAGVNTTIAPMYLSEIAPVHLRGAFGTMNQFGIVSGILIANILGLQQLLGTSSGWPVLFLITAIIGALQLIFLPFCPESPRYLLAIKKDEHTATKNLMSLRGTDDVSEEIEEIRVEAARESEIEKVGVIDLFSNSDYHKPLLISIVMQLSQQLSGIGGILYYSTELFKSVGLAEKYSQIATCGVGTLSVIMTIIVVFLVEKSGRRILMLIGLGGMTVLFVVITIALKYAATERWAQVLSIVATLLSVAFFQIGPGPIPWFIVAELFTQSSISAAVSIAGPTNWLGNFVVGLLFPIIKKNIHPYTFLPFIVLLIIFFIFTSFVVPETKGLTVSEINEKLRDEEPKLSQEIQGLLDK